MLILTGGGVVQADTTPIQATVKPVSALVSVSTTTSMTSSAATTTSNLNNLSAEIAPTSTDSTSSTPQIIPTNANVKAAVATFFANEPLMVHIAACESRDRQYEPNGSVFRGVVNDKDVGVMQINEKYHGKRANSLGIDIYSLEGNMEYAKLLYEEQGSQPWNSSSACWGQYASDNKLAMK